MIHGPSIIKKCSECSQLIIEETYNSRNTFEATFWTDGRFVSSSFPDELLLVECPNCQALLWINKLKKIGTASSFSDLDKYEGVANFKVPSAERYFQVLKDGPKNKPDKERYLRIRAWWAANDKRRDPDKMIVTVGDIETFSASKNELAQRECWEATAKKPLSDQEAENLEALAELLDKTIPGERLTLAEIMRELGRFDDASELLTGQFEGDLHEVAKTIRDLIRKKDRYVAEVEFLW